MSSEFTVVRILGVENDEESAPDELEQDKVGELRISPEIIEIDLVGSPDSGPPIVEKLE